MAQALKNSKVIWRTIYRILKPYPQGCTASPTSLNINYSSLAANLNGLTSILRVMLHQIQMKIRTHLLSN